MQNFKLKISLLTIGLLAFLVPLSPVAVASETYDFTYEGRITDTSGKPYQGTFALQIDFFHEAQGGDPVLTVTEGLENVPMTQAGLFQIKLSLNTIEYSKVFPDVSQPVYMSFTDLTHNAGQPLPRQQIMMMPYAGKVPVDGRTVRFGPDGKLTAAPRNRPRLGEFLTLDANGNFSWATPGLRGGSIGEVLGPLGMTTPNTRGADLTLSAGNGTGSSGSGALIFQTAPGAVNGNSSAPNTPEPRMLVTNTGNVGIGTISPVSKLQISGGQVSVDIPSTLTPTGTSQAIDWNKGNVQVINLASATGNVTLTLNNPVAGATYALKVVQGINARNVTWPASVKWPSGTPTVISSSNGAIDLITLFYDGSNYLAFGARDFR